MGIGGSIFLIAVGAIIAFGVHVQMGWLAGFVGLVLTLWFWNARRRRVVTQRPTSTTEYVETPPDSRY